MAARGYEQEKSPKGSASLVMTGLKSAREGLPFTAWFRA